MRFEFEGQIYETKTSVNTIYLHDLPIQLPGGRFVRVSFWLESSPPIPRGIVEVDKSQVGNKIPDQIMPVAIAV